MLSRWRRSIRERLRPGPEDTSDEEVRRSVERGSTPWRARALRVAAVRGIPLELPLVQTLLSDVGPGVRRATAWACGFSGEPVWVEPLAARLAAEPTRTVARELAIAAVRCGGSVAAFETALAGVLRRPVATWYGERDLSQAAGDAVGRQLKWYRAALGGGSDSARPFRSLRAERLSSIAADPDDHVLLAGLGALGHPHDLDLILRVLRGPGRRGQHAATEALGLLGDPRAVGPLFDILNASDVDPGHGFRGRALAAESLGSLGLPETGGRFRRALVQEALDHEGRPGAGLGIQLPVRSVLLMAIGEAGAVELAPELVRYLGNTHGSALGGFHLPAMASLVQLGATEPLLPLLKGPELVVANAIGVLGALGEREVVEPFVGDPRTRVAEAARRALELTLS